MQAELQITADGIFGPQTEGAVKAFQLAQRMDATGIVDAKTWAALFATDVRFYEERRHGVGVARVRVDRRRAARA